MERKGRERERERGWLGFSPCGARSWCWVKAQKFCLSPGCRLEKGCGVPGQVLPALEQPQQSLQKPVKGITPAPRLAARSPTSRMLASPPYASSHTLPVSPKPEVPSSPRHNSVRDWKRLQEEGSEGRGPTGIGRGCWPPYE